MSIILIRHGETADNNARRVQMPDARLSSKGLEQADLLAIRLKQFNITKIVSSDFTRAQQTAQAIQHQLQCQIEFSDLLHERNFGDLRGRSYDDINLDFFDVRYRPPNGETWDDFVVRVARAWQWIIQIADKQVGSLAVVTHGLVVKALCEAHLQRPAQINFPPSWSNASITSCAKQSPFQIETVNDVEHLAELESRKGGIV